MKRLLKCSLILAIVVLFISNVAFADISDYIWGSHTDTWNVKSATQNADTNNGYAWDHFHTSYPAGRAGEKVTVGTSMALNVSLTGAMEVSMEQLRTAIGLPSLTIGGEAEISGSITSAPFAKGEYVKAYSRPCFNEWAIVQTGSRTGRAYLKGPDGKPTGNETIVTVPLDSENVYVYRPISLQFKLSYFSSADGVDSLNQRPVRSEIYTLIDGQYRLTAVEYGDDALDEQ